MKPPLVLAVSSYAVHGTASLKTFITILGEKILPVPSLLLNGLTNMSLVRKFDLPFSDLLESTLALAAHRERDLLLYVGYLGAPAQAEILTEAVARYRPIIKTIIVDPICGDHGRTYVPPEVIAQWPTILALADLAFPNLTELKILTGHPPEDHQSLEEYVQKFQFSFPTTDLVVTSVINGSLSGIEAFGKIRYGHYQPTLNISYGGTGDAMVAQFIAHHYFKQYKFTDALQRAVDQTHQLIHHSITQGSDDLILEPPAYE